MDQYPITLFHDGNCPICRLDVANLRSRDAAGRLAFIDIAAPAFNPDQYGMTQAAFAEQIRAQLPDGTWITGMEVFRRAYRAVGLGWVIAATEWGPLRAPADTLYRLFARHRPAISKRFGFLFEGLEAIHVKRRANACRSGRCGISNEH
ncbi:MAG: DUF393 domain-containing protein [Rhodocyclaceae bacterium]|nr:DUF393 domain-containing protein [Rhodocyclaceae bacterium]